ncbi:hypothetical protein AAY473_002991 [Plecturocebus cupreus]
MNQNEFPNPPTGTEAPVLRTLSDLTPHRRGLALLPRLECTGRTTAALTLQAKGHSVARCPGWSTMAPSRLTANSTSCLSLPSALVSVNTHSWSGHGTHDDIHRMQVEAWVAMLAEKQACYKGGAIASTKRQAFAGVQETEKDDVCCSGDWQAGRCDIALSVGHFGRPRQENCMSPGVRDQPGQQSKTQSLQKNTKISQAWWYMPIVPVTWDTEARGSLGHFGSPRWADHLSSGVQDKPGQHGKTSSLLKSTKLSHTWWRAPVIPTTREAEAGESFEPRRQRLHYMAVQVTSYLYVFPFLSSGHQDMKSRTELPEELEERMRVHGRLRQKNRLNPGGGGCSELRLRHCTPAWVTERDSISKK